MYRFVAISLIIETKPFSASACESNVLADSISVWPAEVLNRNPHDSDPALESSAQYSRTALSLSINRLDQIVAPAWNSTNGRGRMRSCRSHHWSDERTFSSSKVGNTRIGQAVNQAKAVASFATQRNSRTKAAFSMDDRSGVNNCSFKCSNRCSNGPRQGEVSNGFGSKMSFAPTADQVLFTTLIKVSTSLTRHPDKGCRESIRTRAWSLHYKVVSES